MLAFMTIIVQINLSFNRIDLKSGTIAHLSSHSAAPPVHFPSLYVKQGEEYFRFLTELVLTQQKCLGPSDEFVCIPYIFPDRATKLQDNWLWELGPTSLSVIRYVFGGYFKGSVNINRNWCPVSFPTILDHQTSFQLIGGPLPVTLKYSVPSELQ